MESLAAYLRDMDLQAAAADGFAAPERLSEDEQRRAVFTGSGDSLAAAMLAEAFSDYRVRALDPREIGRNPRIVAGRSLYIVSVSGRTAANVRLAREHGAVAITAVPDSALARAARRTIPLSFPNSDTLTAGSISFLNSALVCLSLVRPALPRNAPRILERARRDAASTPHGDRTYFVGNQHTFPVAMYAAAKTYEILGADAHYARTEQFAHMELFSAKPGDAAVFFDDGEQVREMVDALERQGISCNVAEPRLGDPVSDIIYDIFYAQALPLNRTDGGAEVYFMDADALRGISDAVIYEDWGIFTIETESRAA
ncbi:MAG: sugar isomerase [Nitrosopumilaceae archaeon]|nr:sugar isomerase [Nitrosopumilaceae archaeon]